MPLPKKRSAKQLPRFHRAIQVCLDASGKTRKDLATLLHVNRRTVGKYMAGENALRKENLDTIVGFFQANGVSQKDCDEIAAAWAESRQQIGSIEGHETDNAQPAPPDPEVPADSLALSDQQPVEMVPPIPSLTSRHKVPAETVGHYEGEKGHAGVRIVRSSHNVPYSSRTPYFTGRKELLEQLDHHLAFQSPVALTQPISISGLGGIGKTQVALEYAHHHQRHYRHVLWAAADSRETLITEMRKLARSLDLPEEDEKDPNRIVSAVRDWLAAYPNWLLILDNVEDLNLVTWFMPLQPLGAVLLTTRLQTTEPIALALTVETMPKEVGALLLLRRTKRLAPDAPLDVASAHDEYLHAQEISQRLGGLPLALDQAGAYILGTRCALADYQLVYDKQHATLLARRAKVPTDHPHPESVTTTFSLAFERVQGEDPAAADLLRLCAFLAPDAIPETFITEGAAHLGPVLAPVVADPYAFNEVIEVLGSLSLIQRDASERTLSLHRLVQVVLRDQMSDAVQQDWIARCLLLLDHFTGSKTSMPKPSSSISRHCTFANRCWDPIMPTWLPP